MAEPVSVDTAKLHLRVTDTSEDTLIGGYITAAREWVENYTGQILVQREVVQPFRMGFRPISSCSTALSWT